MANQLRRAWRDTAREAILLTTRPELTVVATPYKVASTTLFDRLCQPLMFTGCHAQVLRSPLPRVLHFSIKMHTGDGLPLHRVAEMAGQPIDRVISLLRPPDEIYLSALFQNITDASYPYFFGSKDDVLRAMPEALVEHYQKFDWSNYKHLSREVNAEEIRAYTGRSYLDFLPGPGTGDFRVVHGQNTVDGRPVTTAIANQSLLNDEAAFRRFLAELELPKTLWKRRLYTLSSNEGGQKWYAEKYSEVKALMRAQRQTDDPGQIPRVAAAQPSV